MELSSIVSGFALFFLLALVWMRRRKRGGDVKSGVILMACVAAVVVVIAFRDRVVGYLGLPQEWSSWVLAIGAFLVFFLVRLQTKPPKGNAT